MSWRNVYITQRSKVDLRMNHMIVRSNDDVTKIYLGEVESVMFETTQVSVTSALLAELAKQKIRVIICDTSHNPISEIVPYYGSHDSSLRIKKQFNWSDKTKGEIWKEIVKQKLINQNKLLIEFEKENYYIEMINKFIEDVEEHDKGNMEAVGAKAYFRGLFGENFYRTTKSATNAALDYGYHILVSSFNKEIKSSGYLTEVGIHHDSQHNHFNFSSDLMEPLRPVIDKIVYLNIKDEFGTEEKRTLQKVSDLKFKINGKMEYFLNAIRIYVKSILDALENDDINRIKWIEV